MMNIINMAKIRNVDGRFEKHHIVPRCWYRANGLIIDNSPNNLVNLTKEEHAKVHLLIPLCCNEEIAGRMKYCNRLMSGRRMLGVKQDPSWIKKRADAVRGKERLDLRGKKMPERSQDHCKKLSESIKKAYIKYPEYRRMNSERQKGHKWSNGSLGMHWYNNGEVNKLTNSCPEGFVLGRLKNGSK